MKTYPPRLRFNWGFHDATADKSRAHDRRAIPQGQDFCLPLFDPVYCAGYEAGQRELLTCGRPESSEAAWLCYQADMIAGNAMAARSA